MGVQNIRTFFSQQSRDFAQEKDIVALVGLQVEHSDALLLKVQPKRTAALDLLAQAAHDNFQILSPQVPAEG
jgi:hypothetical protein